MSTESEVKRHPLAIAWDEWIASDEGQQARAAHFALAREGPYLENRLHRAFDAGARAQESALPIIEPETGWSREWPKENGFYWARETPEDMNITLVEVNRNRLTICGGTKLNVKEAFEDSEFLGPITPADAEQLGRLREAALSALKPLAYLLRHDLIPDAFIEPTKAPVRAVKIKGADYSLVGCNDLTRSPSATEEARPRQACDYRNEECAAYGQTVGNRWICNNHICEVLQGCWLSSSRSNTNTEEVKVLRDEALKGICVYCGHIERYESLEQKASEVGNQMRVDHIRRCTARPELKLIAFSEQLIEKVEVLREALDRSARDRHTVGHYHNGAFEDCQRSACVAARAALDTGREVDGE